MKKDYHLALNRISKELLKYPIRGYDLKDFTKQYNFGRNYADDTDLRTLETMPLSAFKPVELLGMLSILKNLVK